MIPVALADEPVTFDATVRQPGLRAMDELAGKLPARSAVRLATEGADHAGIVYASQERGVGEIIRGLMVIHAVLEADEMTGRVEYL